AAGNPRFSSDIYAVGVLGIQALTRVTVPESIPKDPDTDELQWRGLVQTAVSEGLERIFNKMVCAHFPYRYQSAGEVLTDLEGLSGGNKPTIAVSSPKVVTGVKKPDRGIPWKEWKEWKSYLPVGVGVLGLGMGLLLFNLVRERTDRLVVSSSPGLSSPSVSTPELRKEVKESPSTRSDVGRSTSSTSIEPYQYTSVRVDEQGEVTPYQANSPGGKYVEKGLNLPSGALPLEMVVIPAGTFTMGSPEYEAERSDDEGPQRQVRVKQFLMGRYEVTQAQY
ncbi:MAG: SUMF1/EgtB/PvdO family nonheme iron enzyme, partial [Synechococcales cyanobacterium]